MELRQLEVVREVVSTGSVTGAAGVLHCTPSAVSQQLRLAERAAGTPLVEKDGRGIRVTPAGRALAAAAVDVAVAVERARETCAEFAQRPSGLVRVSAFQSAGELLFPLLLAALPAQIEVECAEHDVAQDEFPAVTALADVVVGHRPRRSPPWQVSGVTTTPLLHEPLDVALPHDHPLTRQDEVAPADLAGEPWITVHPGFPIVNVLTDLEARAGRPFDVRHRINDFHLTEALVAAGQGIALLPRYTSDASRVALRPVRGLHAGRTIEALYRTDRGQRRIVRTVLRVLREQASAVVSVSGTRRGR